MGPFVLFLMFVHHTLAFFDALFDLLFGSTKNDDKPPSEATPQEASKTKPLLVISADQAAKIAASESKLAAAKAARAESQRLLKLCCPELFVKIHKER